MGNALQTPPLWDADQTVPNVPTGVSQDRISRVMDRHLWKAAERGDAATIDGLLSQRLITTNTPPHKTGKHPLHPLHHQHHRHLPPDEEAAGLATVGEAEGRGPGSKSALTQPKMLSSASSSSMHQHATRHCATTPAHVAAVRGHSEALKALWAGGLEIDTPQHDGATPLFHAVQSTAKTGPTAVATLLNIGVNVNHVGEHGDTPIFHAARCGRSDMLKLLVDAGAEVNTPTHHGTTPLMAAAELGDEESVRLLLLNGADLHRSASNGATPLYLAAERGHKRVVKLLAVEAGADVNCQRRGGQTPLFAAALNGWLGVVRVLIRLGADVDLCKSCGTTPAFAVLESAEDDLAAWSGGCGSGGGSSDGWATDTVANKELELELDSPHFWEDDLTSSEEESEANPGRNARRDSDATADTAESDGRVLPDGPARRNPAPPPERKSLLRVLRLLVRSGADLNRATVPARETVLHAAARTANVAAARLIIPHCAVNAQEENGNTPAHVAAQHGSAGVLALLLGAGIELDKSNANGETPLHLAARYDHTRVMNLLIAAGAEVDARRRFDKSTPLGVACLFNSEAAARLLVKHGASLTPAGGVSPASQAAAWGHHALSQLLNDIQRCGDYIVWLREPRISVLLIRLLALQGRAESRLKPVRTDAAASGGDGGGDVEIGAGPSDASPHDLNRGIGSAMATSSLLPARERHDQSHAYGCGAGSYGASGSHGRSRSLNSRNQPARHGRGAGLGSDGHVHGHGREQGSYFGASLGLAGAGMPTSRTFDRPGPGVGADSGAAIPFRGRSHRDATFPQHKPYGHHRDGRGSQAPRYGAHYAEATGAHSHLSQLAADFDRISFRDSHAERKSRALEAARIQRFVDFVVLGTGGSRNAPESVSNLIVQYAWP